MSEGVTVLLPFFFQEESVSKKLYVGNLAFTATEDDLKNAFAAYNPISAKIITDRETGRSRGFAFVEVDDGDKAIAEMNGKDLAGRKLTVNEAREREPRTGGGGGFRQGGYNQGGSNDANVDYSRQGGGDRSGGEYSRQDRGPSRQSGGFNRRDSY